jgi:hypothetical protein
MSNTYEDYYSRLSSRLLLHTQRDASCHFPVDEDMSLNLLFHQRPTGTIQCLDKKIAAPQQPVEVRYTAGQSQITSLQISFDCERRIC